MSTNLTEVLKALRDDREGDHPAFRAPCDALMQRWGDPDNPGVLIRDDPRTVVQVILHALLAAHATQAEADDPPRDVREAADAWHAAHYGSSPAPTGGADLAYCERSTATPTSPVHVRRVGPEGRRLSGGAPNTVLCGADLGSGWDLQSDVPSTLARWRLVPQDRPGRVCITCADLAASLTTKGDGDVKADAEIPDDAGQTVYECPQHFNCDGGCGYTRRPASRTGGRSGWTARRRASLRPGDPS